MSKNSSLLAVSIAAALTLSSGPADAKGGFLGKVVKTVLVEPTVKLGTVLTDATESTVKEVGRGVNTVGVETERGVKNVGEGLEVAAKASIELTETGIDATVSSVQALAKGDLETATRSVTVDRWETVEDIAADAAMESSAIRLVGQVAATAYGGPAGGAAFSGWYGYHASGGDWNAAAKGAAVTLAAAGVTQGVQLIPGESGLTASTAARVAASGAGSVGVATLAGGDADARRNAFWMGAATVAAAETYRSVADIDMSGKVASEGPIAKDPNASMKTYSPDASHVGFEVPELVGPDDGFLNHARYLVVQENGPVMQGIAKVPGMNRMAYFHDQWMRETSVTTTGWIPATIPPAMVVSYMATGAPLAQNLQDTAE